MTEARYSLDDARRFMSLLARPGDVFELRGLARVNGQQHVTSGYFDDVNALAQAAAERSGKDDGVYVTLNPVKESLLFRAPKNAVRRAGGGDTTSDRDVRVRRSILIDVDPTRPAGISSSDAEHEAAMTMARAIRQDLRDAGWPDPILADSGNGAHLIYAVDLPVDDGGLVQRVLARLSKRYSTPELKVDEKVYNAARISKIYGTLTRKGVNAPERPHRLARIIEAPAELGMVARADLDALAPAEAKPSNGTNGTRVYSGPAFNLEQWMAEHFPGAKQKTTADSKIWVLDVCPFNDQHANSEAHVSQRDNGIIGAECKHDSCKWGWKELYAHADPERFERRNAKPANGHKFSDREPPPIIDEDSLVPPSETGPEVLYQHESYNAEYDRIAAQDRDTTPEVVPARPPWWRGPQLTDEIWSKKDEPFIGLTIGGDELCRCRAGGIIVVIGGSGSGKSSLVSNMLIEHAVSMGPAIALSIELPADELAARIVGMKNDASWEDVLRGRVEYKFMAQALALPRLFVLDRKQATLENLRKCADAARKEYPGQPILCAIDYAQLISSREREMRGRVNDAFERIDDVTREKQLVTIAVSQMGRAGAKMARDGERIGADAADLGAESAAIERFATATLTIGMKGEPCEDGSQKVELSLGKGRMSGGDAVFPTRYWGRTGRWRLDGEKKTAADVRAERDTERDRKRSQQLEQQLIGAATSAPGPLTREQLGDMVSGRKADKRATIVKLIAAGRLVEVEAYVSRSKLWPVWTPDRVNATPGTKLASGPKAYVTHGAKPDAD